MKLLPGLFLLFFCGITRGLLVGQIADTSPPNIIFILTDDQRWDALGHAGNEVIHTPEMDRLAEEGAYFENAFVTTPVCAASRASILTGMYERRHGFNFGTQALRREFILNSYPHLLRENGYTTGFIGKFGMWHEDNLDTTLFDFYRRPGEQFWAVTYYRLSSDHSSHRHLTTELGDLSLEFLDKYTSAGPFCLSLSFHAPHAEDVDPRQYIYPLELDSLYQGIEIPAPKLSEDPYFEAQPAWVRSGLNRIRWKWRFDNEAKYQQMVKGYYRMISGVDRELGRIRSKLDELGISNNTIIIFMGDNGYFLGERQLAGKWLMYEPSLRVPLIIYDPGAAAQNREELVLNVDIAPTLLSYAGIDIPQEMQGKDIKSLLSNEEATWRNSFLCEHLMESHKIPKSEGIRSVKWKYFRYMDHPEWEELYNLEEDPKETYNLAKDPAHQGVLKQFRMELSRTTKPRD